MNLNINKKFKKIKWLRVLLVILPPLVLIWPFSPDNNPFPVKTYITILKNDQIINISKLPQKFPLQGYSESLGGKNLFSLLFKIKTTPMPIELCLDNQNKILDDGVEIDPQRLIDADEAGAMSIKFYNKDSGLDDEIYAKINKKECKVLPTEGVNLENIEIRHPLPINVKASPEQNGIKVYVEQNKDLSVLVSDKIGYYHTKWRTSIFFSNFIIFLFAWWIVLASCFSIFKFIYSQNR